MEKVRKAVFMFSDLFGLERYNFTKLVSPPASFPPNSLVLTGELPGHSQDQLPECGLPQLVTRLPRVQQHLQHPQGLAWHLQSSGVSGPVDWGHLP